MTQVLYVMGTGRSGSTVLGLVFGNTPQMFYAGELDAWLRRSGNPNTEDAPTRELWARISDDVSGDELFGDECWRTFEHSAAFVRPRRLLSPELRRRYREVSRRLYESVARVTGAACVVDTSHYPLRARALRDLPGIEQYLVYLTREPTAVVAAMTRGSTQGTKSTVAATVYLWITHALCALVYLRHPRQRRMVIRYEEFTANPEHEIGRIRGWLGLPCAQPDLAVLDTTGPFQGNRLLQQPTVALRTETAASLSKRRLRGVLWRYAITSLARIGGPGD